MTSQRQFISTKTYGHDIGLSCVFRQWQAESHCRLLHGYALAIRIEFEAEALDHRGWVVDFGSLKSLKECLVETFDHKTLIAVDDPELGTFRALANRGLIALVEVPGVGCERFAEFVFDLTEQWLSENHYAPRCRVRMVEVREHGANSAIMKSRYR